MGWRNRHAHVTLVTHLHSPSLPPSPPFPLSSSFSSLSLSRSLARSLSRSLLLLLFLLPLPGEQDARRSPVTVRRVSPVSDEVAYALATGPGLVPSLTLGPHRCRHVPVSVASPPLPPCPLAPQLFGPKKSESRVHLRPPRFCAARLPGPCAAPAGCAAVTQRSRSGAACHTRHARAHTRAPTRARARATGAGLADLRRPA